MTHEQILEQSRKDLKAIYKQAKEKLDAIAPRDAEVGKWYKDSFSNYLVHVTKVLGKHNYVEVYGFGSNGNWFNKWDTVVHQLCVEATPQEVEKALIEEAKRRGYKEGDKIKSLCMGTSTIGGGKYNYRPSENILAINGNWLFKDGQWATIIEQDRFAELKEAFKNGSVIEFRSKYTNFEWEVTLNPAWGDFSEYRIKPEEKPKVGEDINYYQLTLIKDNQESQKWNFCLPLSPQQVQELLFGKESANV